MYLSPRPQRSRTSWQEKSSRSDKDKLLEPFMTRLTAREVEIEIKIVTVTVWLRMSRS